jgi:hypothetical protein
MQPKRTLGLEFWLSLFAGSLLLVVVVAWLLQRMGVW